jgi:hypothetical protein
MSLQSVLSVFIVAVVLSKSYSAAQTLVTPYFSNDSVNGVKISDAYETHNMGLLIEREGSYIQLDLGIVSPDMHIYKNQYRVANRSFGELIELNVGSRINSRADYNTNVFLKLGSSGSFGIDRMQDFMHRLLNLQPVNAVNDLVRMPDKQWIGIGGNVDIPVEQENLPFNLFGVFAYIGSDRAEFSPYLKRNFSFRNFILQGELGVKQVFFDNIVSAPPVSAKYRKLNPYFEVGITFKHLGLTWFVKDQFSLPSIQADDGIFGVLTAGATFELK